MRKNTLTRERLGLSQEQLAEYLGISRSVLANYERTRRSLPTAALIRLSQLEIMFANMQQSKSNAHKEFHQPAVIQRQNAARQAFIKEAKYIDFKIAKIKRELTLLQTMYAQTQEWLFVIQGLSIADLPEKTRARHLKWTAIAQDAATKKLERCDPAAQMMLEIKIAVLAAKAEAYRGV